MSSPESIYFAESKIHQLTVARQCGLVIGDTLISNDPAEVRRFVDFHSGAVVAKALRSGYFDYGDRQTCVYTTLLGDLAVDDDEIRLAPVIYQEHVTKRADVRVTIVGDQLFVALIDSQNEETARVDWRRTATPLPLSRHLLPDSVARGCLALMSRLGLAYGAIDLILTDGGDYVFLEVNPNGEWVWIEDELSLPISAAIAEWLSSASAGATR